MEDLKFQPNSSLLLGAFVPQSFVTTNPTKGLMDYLSSAGTACAISSSDVSNTSLSMDCGGIPSLPFTTSPLDDGCLAAGIPYTSTLGCASRPSGLGEKSRSSLNIASAPKESKEETLRKLERLASAPLASLQLSPFKGPEPVSASVIPQISLEWTSSDFETIKAKYFQIARILVEVYYRYFNTKHNHILNLWLPNSSFEIVGDPQYPVDCALKLLSEIIERFEVGETQLEFFFEREETPSILTVAGQAFFKNTRTYRAFTQSFKIGSRSLFSGSLVNINSPPSILEQFGVFQAKIKFD